MTKTFRKVPLKATTKLGDGEVKVVNIMTRTILVLLTLKKALVEPDSRQPYLILVCLARSSADSIGDSILSTVRKAARLAV